MDETCISNPLTGVGNACSSFPNSSQEASISDEASCAPMNQTHVRVGENCSILPVCHLAMTRLPSIPERSAKSQKLELSAEEEPLPPCKYMHCAHKAFEMCCGNYPSRN